MNMRTAISLQRHRKNLMFEQERAASLDYDSQRAGGYKKKPAKKAGPKRSVKKSSH